MSTSVQARPPEDEEIVGELRSALASKSFTTCLMLCNLRQQANSLIVRQAMAISEIHLASERHDWSAVLKLTGGTTRDDIRKAARRQIVMVHPDKCSLPLAAEAFKIVMAATEKIARTNRNELADDEDHTEGPKWWEVWDEPPSNSDKKRKFNDEENPVQEQLLSKIRGLSIEALRNKVASLQRSVLRPSPGSLEAGLSGRQRQELLRDARSLLAARIAVSHDSVLADSSQSAQAGGFL